MLEMQFMKLEIPVGEQGSLGRKEKRLDFKKRVSSMVHSSILTAHISMTPGLPVKITFNWPAIKIVLPLVVNYSSLVYVRNDAFYNIKSFMYIFFNSYRAFLQRNIICALPFYLNIFPSINRILPDVRFKGGLGRLVHTESAAWTDRKYSWPQWNSEM